MLKALVPAVALLLAAPGVASAETASKTVHRTVALDTNARVDIETYKGSVQVTAWDRGRRPRSPPGSRPTAPARTRNTRPKWSRTPKSGSRGEGSSVSIRSDYGGVDDYRTWSVWPFASCSARPFVHYTISMPRNARLDVTDHKSRIEVDDLASDVTIQTHKGEVRLTGLAGRVNLDTHRGDVRVAFAKVSGDSQFETHSGDIEITDAEGRPLRRLGRFRPARASRLRLPRDHNGSRHHREERAEAAINGGGPALRLTTHSGTFRLRSS